MTENRAQELTEWKGQAQQELEAAQVELAAGQNRVDAARERLALIEKLLALEGNGPGAMTAPVQREESSDFLDACELIVRTAGRPMHISELLSALRESGVALPGRGTDANVIVRLRRSDGRFVRTERGTYGLPEFGIPEVPTTSRRRRTRRRSK